MDHERRIPVGVAAAAPLGRALSAWQASVVLLDQVDPITTELVRLRAAANHDCRTCGSVRLVTATEAGVDETMVAKIERYETSDLDERHKVALRLADALMSQPNQISDTLVADLRAHFTDEQLLELTVDVMKWNYQKVPVALRIDAEPAPGQLTGLNFDERGQHQFILPDLPIEDPATT